VTLRLTMNAENLDHLTTHDLRFLAEFEKLHDVVANEARDRLAESNLDQKERDSGHETDQGRLGEPAHVVDLA
jgi:hypothetical protein